MFKYLAVIQDSFREALASRILWVVLGTITLLLLAVAPLSYREVVTWRLSEGDFSDLATFVRQVRDAADDLVPSPQKYLWSRLDQKLRERLLAAWSEWALHVEVMHQALEKNDRHALIEYLQQASQWRKGFL